MKYPISVILGATRNTELNFVAVVHAKAPENQGNMFRMNSDKPLGKFIGVHVCGHHSACHCSPAMYTGST